MKRSLHSFYPIGKLTILSLLLATGLQSCQTYTALAPQDLQNCLSEQPLPSSPLMPSKSYDWSQASSLDSQLEKIILQLQRGPDELLRTLHSEVLKLQNGSTSLLRQLGKQSQVNGFAYQLLALGFEADSIYIDSFILLLEDSHGWQALRLFPNNGSMESPKDGYSGGYNLVVTPADFNADGRQELLFTSSTGGSGGLHSKEIIEVREKAGSESRFSSYPIPALVVQRASFADDYKINVAMLGLKRKYVLQRKAENIPVIPPSNGSEASLESYFYDNQGIYRGTQKPWYYAEPSQVSARAWPCAGETISVLEAVQPLKGLSNADNLGEFYSYWVLRNGKWLLLDYQFKPSPSVQILETLQE